jgi:hypothetical protein
MFLLAVGGQEYTEKLTKIFEVGVIFKFYIMKKLNFIFLALLFISLYSCDKDQIEQTPTETISESSKFLKSFYSEAYTNGKSMNIDNNTMLVTEILGTTQKTPVGYTVTNSENSELLYFVAVNTQKDLLTSIDFKNDKETVSFSLNNFLKNQEVKSIDNFSFLNLIKNIDNSTSKRRFWGRSCGPCSTGMPQNIQTCCYYIFWTQNGCKSENC